jgi:hypothetical protein
MWLLLYITDDADFRWKCFEFLKVLIPLTGSTTKDEILRMYNREKLHQTIANKSKKYTENPSSDSSLFINILTQTNLLMHEFFRNSYSRPNLDQTNTDDNKRVTFITPDEHNENSSKKYTSHSKWVQTVHSNPSPKLLDKTKYVTDVQHGRFLIPKPNVNPKPHVPNAGRSTSQHYGSGPVPYHGQYYAHQTPYNTYPIHGRAVHQTQHNKIPGYHTYTNDTRVYPNPRNSRAFTEYPDGKRYAFYTQLSSSNLAGPLDQVLPCHCESHSCENGGLCRCVHDVGANHINETPV